MSFCLYILGLLIIITIMIVSKQEKLPNENLSKGIDRTFEKMSFYLYRKFASKNKYIRRISVKRNLNIIYPDANSDDSEKNYYSGKIKNVLIIFFAGCILSAFVDISEKNESRINEEGTLPRNSYMEGNLTEEMLLEDNNGEQIGEYRIEISEREYTRQQTGILFDEMAGLLPDIIKANNPSLEEIRENIVLPDKVEGYPFEIEWTIDNHNVIHSDGSVENTETGKEGETVTLTAECKYREIVNEVVLHAVVLPKIISPQEIQDKEIYDAVKKNDEETLTEEYIRLPDKTGTKQLVWHKKLRNNGILLFLLIIIASIAIFIMKDQDLNKIIEARKEELSKEYPQFVSKLVLYMGAGMTLRNIIFRITEKYCNRNSNTANAENERNVNKGVIEKQPELIKELCRIRYEMISGIPEIEAFGHLCERCGVQEYTRLCNLLIQNMRKGNSGLLPLLKEESEKATEKRLDNARKAGEQASTRLLMPMMMMLAIVMVLIMIPAYMSF